MRVNTSRTNYGRMNGDEVFMIPCNFKWPVEDVEMTTAQLSALIECSRSTIYLWMHRKWNPLPWKKIQVATYRKQMVTVISLHAYLEWAGFEKPEQTEEE